MSWKSRGVSVFRQVWSGPLVNNSKLKKGMTTWPRCENNSREQQPECCAVDNLMDEAPTPEGPWKQNYERQNAKDTRILVIGIVNFIISVLAVKKLGLLKGHPEITIF